MEKLDRTYDWDAVLIGFTGGIEPHNGANLLRSSGNLHLWHPNQPSPATGWEAEIDRLIEVGSRELDGNQRRSAYWRIQEILHEELPLIQTVRQNPLHGLQADTRELPAHGVGHLPARD